VKHGMTRDWNRIKAAEMKYLRSVKGCTRVDQVRNEDTQKELGIFSNYENNSETNGKYICKEWYRLAFHFKPINIVSGR
jgi:hypothetical protein